MRGRPAARPSYGDRVPQRARLALVLAVAFLAVAAGSVLVFGSDGEDAPMRPSATFHGAIRPPGIPPAEFRLRDERGDTTCEDTCPTTAQQIAGGLDRLGHDVPAVAIAVDQVTPDALAADIARLERERG